jgi:hypothetical protein
LQTIQSGCHHTVITVLLQGLQQRSGLNTNALPGT